MGIPKQEEQLGIIFSSLHLEPIKLGKRLYVPSLWQVYFSLTSISQKVTRTQQCTVPEFIDPVFTKTSPKRSFSLNRIRAFWLVFTKTGSIISGTDVYGVTRAQLNNSKLCK
jgi:hypothetical protein